MTELTRFIALLAAVSFGAVGCDNNATPNPRTFRVASPLAAPGAVARAATGLASWRASNEQAKTIAGNLYVARSMSHAGAVSLAFAHGITIHAIENLDQVTTVNELTLRAALGAPDRAPIQLFSVVEERVTISAPLGGLCGGLRTRVLALSVFNSDDGDQHLRLAAFSGPRGAHTEGAGAIDASQPCFAFDFEGP